MIFSENFGKLVGSKIKILSFRADSEW